MPRRREGERAVRIDGAIKSRWSDPQKKRKGGEVGGSGGVKMFPSRSGLICFEQKGDLGDSPNLSLGSSPKFWFKIATWSSPDRVCDTSLGIRSNEGIVLSSIKTI